MTKDDQLRKLVEVNKQLLDLFAQTIPKTSGPVATSKPISIQKPKVTNPISQKPHIKKTLKDLGVKESE
jgi:hypothetical protein